MEHDSERDVDRNSENYLDITRFATLAETWGGNIERWPALERTAARRIAATDAGKAILAEARKVDDLIVDAMPGISEERLSRAMHAVIADLAQTTAALPRSWIPSWLTPAASFICAAAVGVWLGFADPVALLGNGAGTASVLTLIFDNGSMMQDWIAR
jgi:hypothetical protein